MKTILITGSTDGIGLASAKALLTLGHTVWIHGRDERKLAHVSTDLSQRFGEQKLQAFCADLGVLDEVTRLAERVSAAGPLDVLINNAGVFNAPDTLTEDGWDVRFAVNTIAPYLLTRRLMPFMPSGGRVINLSSAAQAAFDLDELKQYTGLSANAAYAKSKLALTMWTAALAQQAGSTQHAMFSVNPGSLLGTKMVKEAFGRAGGDIQIGAKILVQAALSDTFSEASGAYFDNDVGRFAPAHPDVADTQKCVALLDVLNTLVGEKI